MTLLRLAIETCIVYLIGIAIPRYLSSTHPFWQALVKPFLRPCRTLADRYGEKTSGVVLVGLCILLCFMIKYTIEAWIKSEVKEKGEIYGLEHGRLHLQVSTPMWMNMGYWDEAGATKSLAEACRDLLNAVLAEAGFSSETERGGTAKGTRRKRMLLDMGIGCGDQSIYLMSQVPVQPCDREWWDEEEHYVLFDHYIGITNDCVQARRASERVAVLRRCRKVVGDNVHEEGEKNASIFCADAAKPAIWEKQIQKNIEAACTDCPERWVLALDTAYHFSPSRWPLIEYAHTSLHASFMAFDLCLSPTATFRQKLLLRFLTWFMGAPFTNFVTPEDYRKKLLDIGCANDAIKVVDISERVFTPLSQYLGEQDRRLKMLGLGIGKFGVAKSLFKWWGRSGVVRGVIVVAKK